MNFTVEDLEDLIEGYSNVFDEKEVVQIESHVLDTQDMYFDETFGNVAVKFT